MSSGAGAAAGTRAGAAETAWLERFVAGPTRSRWAEIPVQVGDPAPDFSLPDQSGAPHRLSEFWSQRTALIIFWRHFACGCGLARAERLLEEIDGYRAAGSEVVIVGQGEPARAAAYGAATGLEIPILSDTEISAYHAYGLVDGTPAQILFDAPEEYWEHGRATGERLVRQRREMGRPMVDHPWLLPGEFVVDTSGTIRLAYRYQYCEDFPNPLVLMAAIRGA